MQRRNELLGLALLTLVGGQALAEPVAWIGDESIDTSQIDALAGEPVRTARQMLYSARHAALQEHLREVLYSREAAARGISVEQLHEVEVLEQIPAMSLAEVRRAMAQRGIEAEDDNPLQRAVARQAFEELRVQEREETFLDELKTRYGVVVLLQLPQIPAPMNEALDRVPIRHARGPADAPVTIRLFSDYTCGACMHMDRNLNTLYGDEPTTVRIVHHPWPLDTDEDSTGMQAAVLTECAAERGDFWAMHGALHNQWDGEAETLAEIAEAQGFDAEALARCLKSDSARERVEADIAAAQPLDISAAPVTFVNGFRVDGAMEPGTLRSYVTSASRQAAGG